MINKKNILTSEIVSLGKRILIFLLFLLCLSPSLIFADGGILKFRQSLPDEEISPWTSENYGRSAETQAMMRLDKDKQEEVFVIDFHNYQNSDQPKRTIIVSQSIPPRLFYDLNEDGVCQAGEIYTGQPAQSDYTYPIYDFKNVKFPIMGKSLLPMTDIDIQIYLSSKIPSLHIKKIKSCYEGLLNIADKEYQARLIFLSMNPNSKINNEIFILDTNKDGIFYPFEDFWFPNTETAFIDGKNWNVSTEFKGSEVNIQLTPYTGSTGNLIIKGENFHRLYLGDSSNNELMICLPGCYDPTFTLPIGNYGIKKIWLQTDNPNELLETLDNQSSRNGRSTPIQINTSAPLTVQFGGDLKNSFQVSHSFMGGTVHLRYDGMKDSSGNVFSLIKRSEAGKVERLHGPQWELCNAQNTVIASGRFEYG